MTKDRTINIRISSDRLARLDEAARVESEEIGYRVSRNAFIESAIDDAIEAVESRNGYN